MRLSATLPKESSPQPIALTSVEQRTVLITLGLIIIGRLCLHLILDQLGLVSLTADEFGRLNVAARWAQQPTLIWSGFWLPLHTYLTGGIAWLGADWWNSSRLITIVLGLVSIALMYQLGQQVTQDYRVALLGAGLLALNPVHIWLTAVPLTEIWAFAILLVFLVGFLRYLRERRASDLWLAAGALLVANSLRYEAWMWSVLFSGAVGLHALRAKGLDAPQRLSLLAAGVLPWVVPIVWVIGNAWQTGDPFYFYTYTKAYERTWHGATQDMIGYLMLVSRSDPLLMVLSAAAFVYLAWSQRQSEVVRWFLIVASVPLILFIAIQGGLRLTEGQMYRRIALLVWQLYPLVAFALAHGIRWLVQRRPQLEPWVLGLVLVGISAFQLNTAFAFTNDPAAKGLAVGRRLVEVQRNLGAPSEARILVERIYWEYVAIQVGANDVSGLVFDRPVEDTRSSPSWLLLDTPVVQQCLQALHIKVIVVKSAELQAIVTQDLGATVMEEINGYQLYALPPLAQAAGATEAACPVNATSP